ncbi:hypothetical protein E8E13_008513 [Curvularia kusanoi]|uniref:O-methyltransferase C-terminal domain-containing protein n=1 Tax=Curvularia kusanoi TaxID=90978 RepID=A0A9P4TB08_CURKU|nr:hypothetical protein E8E13_008513 [Curvularia kusanoi]
MASQTDSQKSIPAWLSAYLPTGDARTKQEGVDSGNVWWVEVGGRDGSQLAAVAKAFPRMSARMILQNNAAVLEAAPKIEGVETMVHDTLTEQPVHNASVYYFRQILGTFDDVTCIHILQMHLPALKHNPGSRIVIDDTIVPDQEPAGGASSVEGTEAQHAHANDGPERREKRWRWLIDQAGMEVLAINEYRNHDGLIIAKRRYQDQYR